MEKRPLSLAEYNRIYQTACGILNSVGSNPERSCIFFACYGAYILEKHYSIAAIPVAGGFALRISDEPNVAFFGKDDGAKVSTDSDGFHMWVQTKTHYIDFMAPLFPEAFGKMIPGIAIPRKMFQRAIVTEAPSLDDLRAKGDFITLPDPELTKTLGTRFISKPVNSDLVGVAEAWFGRPGGKQQQTFAMRDDLGRVQNLSLPTAVAVGSW
ncbi:MAG: hypothetical protein DI582_02840 [Azospirillum brasilense]|nr:MAG: hypothetical protein DI582_02840 [Azospirillum brasilense]